MTMSSESRILWMPRCVSAVSKAWVGVGSGWGHGWITGGSRWIKGARQRRQGKELYGGRAWCVGTWLRLSSLLVALSSSNFRRSGRKALMSALKAMPFCHGVCTVVR